MYGWADPHPLRVLTDSNWASRHIDVRKILHIDLSHGLQDLWVQEKQDEYPFPGT